MVHLESSGTTYVNFVRNNELQCNVDAVHVWIFHVGEHGADQREIWLGMIKEELPKASVMPVPLSVRKMDVAAVEKKMEVADEMKDNGD